MSNTTKRFLMAASGAGSATYVDDVFSSYLYKGNETARSINNGVDNTEGGMVWVKNRDNSAFPPYIYDTERGVNKQLRTSSTATETTGSNTLTSFNNDGITIGNDTMINRNGDNHVAWNFRKAKGFFDIVKYTGTGVAGREIPHNLGCTPGFYTIKCLEANDQGESQEWTSYHSSLGAGQKLYLNKTDAAGSTGYIGPVTDTYFTVPTASANASQINVMNRTGVDYICYLFAGGESTADTARSVYFQAGAEYLESSSSDYVLGTGDFTVELWFKTNDHGAIQRLFDKRTASNTSGGVLSIWQEHLYWHIDGSNGPIIGSGSCKIRRGQWYHAAVVRHSSTTKLYLNGEDVGTLSNDTTNYDTSAVRLGEAYNGGYGLNGNISNFRIVVGTALYTSPFKPPTEPLTSITNTKLLCCNNSSVTGKTTGATITASGTLAASTDNPFDDIEGYKFGKGGDQNIIKCGEYVGNQNADGPEVYLGWEPQFIILKPTSGSENWGMWDSMRGIVTGGNDMRLLPNTTHAEITNFDGLSLTPTGFTITSSNHLINPDATGVVYIAIRRPDGYVGKPVEAGTDAFAMDTGAGSSTIPNFDSGFPVDFAFYKNPGSGGNWITGSRLTSGKYLHVNNTDTESSSNVMYYDSNVGWNKDSSGNSSWQSWMWKRGQGFDVVNYVGNQTSGHQIPHSLGQPPEMIWTKNRDQIQQWSVGHKGLNGGTNPWNWVLVLSDAEAEQESTNFWEAPTATHFTVDSDARVNKNNLNYLAILFSSVEGISKVGSYTGSSSALTITTGFQPRFVIIKNVVDTGYNWTTGWFTFDTTRGWAAGNNDKRMRLNDTAAQTTEDWTNPISTGFTINANSGNHLNHNGERYIYYAHA